MPNDSWISPPEWVEPARATMGGIDLDPATSREAAEHIVKAEANYTAEANGLGLPWYGRVWLNPPYSMPLIEQFVYRLSAQYQAGNVSQAVLLVNTATETAWYKHMAKRYPLALGEKRIRFLQTEQRPPYNSKGEYQAPLTPVPINGYIFYRGDQNRVAQTLFYLGSNVEAFYRAYAHLAYCPTGTVKPFLAQEQ